jgi:hypothetical protein
LIVGQPLRVGPALGQIGLAEWSIADPRVAVATQVTGVPEPPEPSFQQVPIHR